MAGPAPATPDRPPRTGPAGRDPFLDVIRAFAMVAVVANHFLYTLLFRNPSGQFELIMLQESGHPWVTWPFVWELQAFFLPAAALSFGPALRTGGRRFVGRRLWRLLVPVVPLVVGLVVLEASTRAAGMGDCATWTTGLTCATAMPIAPLWFLVVLVPLTALTPWLARHWHGRWRIGLPLAVVAVTVVSDALWIGGGSALPLNEVTVWALVWFAGFAYADGTFDRVGVRTWWAVVAGGTVVMVALVVVGPYPPWLGASPRTMMTVLECVVGVSLLLALRGPITAVRDRRAVDWTVRNVGDRIMGVFLWHYLAFAAVISAAGLAGVDLAEHLGWPYVAQRAVIIPVALVLLVGLLRVVAPVDRIPYPADRRRARRSDAVAEPLDGPGGRR